MVKPNNFGDLPAPYLQLDSAKIVILPVPYDATSTWIKGADKGPVAIITASANLELYDIETDAEVYRQGIFTAPPVLFKSAPDAMVKQVETQVSHYLKQHKFVMLIGGEHSVSIGSIFSHAKFYKNFSVLQLDAHADWRDEYSGSRYNHACVMARAQEIAPVVQVGLRSMDISEKNRVNFKNIFLAENIVNQTNWAQAVIKKLNKNVYLTIDLDVFDPAIMPSTGTPEPGGLGWYPVLNLIKQIVKSRNLVGADVVELCPNKINKSPDFLAAKLIYKILSYKFK